MKIKARTLAIIFYCLITFTVHTSTIDTVDVFSMAMHKSIKCVVIKPGTYDDDNTKFPVVYLLHGYSGSYDNWIKRVPEIKL